MNECNKDLEHVGPCLQWSYVIKNLSKPLFCADDVSVKKVTDDIVC